MSKSVKVTPRFSDPRDRAYLSLLGTSYHGQNMEEARVRVQPFELPGIPSLGGPTPLIPMLPQGEAPTFSGITVQQRRVLENLGQSCKEAGYRPHISAIPSSTGGIVIDLQRGSREKVYARKGARDDQGFHRGGWHDNF